ncbi:MAG TPA: UvrD-helicase domain-containing protein, partial [Gemmatimonadaceae bacterium]|nr:UvrD-helicase domain-containing protein [Gemmatimonadaceae bacterium]
MTDERQPSLFEREIETAVGRYDRRSARRDASVARVPFDPLGVSLEPGISLVEASAGTGKTFCIAQMVLRLLLEPRPDGAYREIGRILVVTFTNKATDELITRVRARLREAVAVFAGAVPMGARKDEALFALRERYGDAGLPRLQAALRALDQLSIFTIHGFCKRVLEESALESGTPYDATFLEEDALLVERAARDWWRRRMYVDDRLAALAVSEGWSFDGFVEDWKTWRRLPRVAIDPDERLDVVLGDLARAAADFAHAWDPEVARAFLAERAWYAASPLAGEASQARAVSLGDALAAGDLGAACELVAGCSSAAMLHEKKGAYKKKEGKREAIASEPFVLAIDRVAAALARLRCALRVDCIQAIDLDFQTEKERRHLLGFDDLLMRLSRTLREQGPDGQLARAIRARYDAALIDEFQDTDPHQFPIFSHAFAGRPLFLIGDPKQAIYGFRGADLHAYIDATHAADREYTLGRNWRSTPRMVGAVNALFARRPDPFLHDEIPFEPASAARDDIADLPDARVGALHWWFVPPETSGKGLATCVGAMEAARRLHWTLVREVVRLLRGGEGRPPLRAGQMAVLVRTGREGLAVQAELRRAGVPCIVAGVEDILQSREMRELEAVLRAVLAPQQARTVRAALATELWGMDAAAIHGIGTPEREHEWQALAERLEEARESWVSRGFMRMVQEL